MTNLPIPFEPNDVEAVRRYVDAEVEREGGLSMFSILGLSQVEHDDREREMILDIIDAAPRLSDAPII